MTSLDGLSSPAFKMMSLRSPEVQTRASPAGDWVQSTNSRFLFPPRGPSQLCERLRATEESLAEGSEDEEEASPVDENLPSPAFTVPFLPQRPLHLVVGLPTPPDAATPDFSATFSTKSGMLPPLHPAPLSSACASRRSRSATEDGILADTRFGFFGGPEDFDRSMSSCSFAGSPYSVPQSSPLFSSARASPTVSAKRGRPDDLGSPELSASPVAAAPAELFLNIDIKACNVPEAAQVDSMPPTPAAPIPTPLSPPSTGNEDSCSSLLLPVCGFQSSQKCITGETVSPTAVPESLAF